MTRRLLPLLFFAGVACLSLYWQLFHAATHVGATLPTDYYHFHWNFWWMRHALTAGQNIYITNYVLTPATTNLAFHTLTPFWFPIWAVIEPLFGTMIAMNAIFVLASTLTGWAFYLLLRRHEVNQPLALAGGVILQTTPAMLLSAWLSNINYLSLFWLPLILLLWDALSRSVDRPRRAVMLALIVGAALYAMLMTDYQFAVFLAFLIIPFGAWTLIRRSWRLIIYGGIALLVSMTLFWFAGALPYILMFDRSRLSPMSIENAFGIPFPQGYFTRLSPYTRSISLGAFVLPGVIVALAAQMVEWFRRKSTSPRHMRNQIEAPVLFWFCLILPPLLLSLGATITIGAATIPTPYVPFHDLFGGMFRVPNRFAPVIIIPAWLFIGQTLSRIRLPRLAQRFPRVAWAAPLLLLVFADANLFEPMPLRPLPPMYDFYTDIGRDPRDYAILDVPVAGGSGEAWVGEFPPMETQFYALIHGKRVFNGSVARAPLDSFWSWLYDDPLMAWLGQRRYLEPELMRQTLIERIASVPIGYIVIHQNYMDRSAPTVPEIVGFFNQLDDAVCFDRVEGDAIVYRTYYLADHECAGRAPIPDAGSRVFWIDIGAVGDERYIGQGYHPSETISGVTWRWTGAHPQIIDTYVDLDARPYTVTFNLQSFAEPRRVGFVVNDLPVGDYATVTPDSLRPYTWEIPTRAIGDGRHVKLTLTIDGTVIPAEIGQGTDQRPLAIAVDLITFTPAG